MPQGLAFPLEASYALHLPLLHFRFFHCIIWWPVWVKCSVSIPSWPFPVSCLCPALPTAGMEGRGRGRWENILVLSKPVQQQLKHWCITSMFEPEIQNTASNELLWCNTLKHTKYRNTCPFLLILKVVLTVYCCCGNGFYLVCHLCF